MADGHHDVVDQVLAVVGELVEGVRGDASQVAALIESSPLPMLLLDNDRRYRDTNRPACLLFRLTREEILARGAEDVTRPADWGLLEDVWSRLMSHGFDSGEYTFALPDGTRAAVAYHVMANVTPGRHLAVLIPKEWCEDELGPLEGSLSGASLGAVLTARELDVMRLVAQGAELEELSERLALSPHTVKVHLRNIYRKLGARNRAHAVALALRHEML